MSYGCCNSLPQTWVALKQRTFILSRSWRLEGQNRAEIEAQVRSCAHRMPREHQFLCLFQFLEPCHASLGSGPLLYLQSSQCLCLSVLNLNLPPSYENTCNCIWYSLCKPGISQDPGLNHIARSLRHVRRLSEVQGVRRWLCLEAFIWPVTVCST